MFFIFLFICLNNFSAIFFNAVLKGQVLAVNVLEKNSIFHLITELFVLQAAKFDKWADIIPVLLVFLSLGLAHTGQLICHFLRNVFSNFINKSIILQSTS